MSEATVWTAQSDPIPVVNTNGNIMEEWQVATGGQTVFTLVSFEYTPGTNSLFVFKDGLILHRDVDYTETDESTITLTSGATLNDRLTFLAIAIAQAEAPLFEHGVPAGGDTGQYLAKVNSDDYNTEWIDPPPTPASLQDGTRTNVASASTVNLVAIEDVTRNILITGTTTIGGFQISDGQLWAVKFAAALTLTNSASLVTQTGADVKVVANSTCFIRATADNQVEVLAMTKAFDIGGPAFSACRNTEQTIATTTATKLQANTEEFDTDNCYDAVTNYRFTPSVPGYYLFTGAVSWNIIASSASTQIYLYKNGTLFKTGSGDELDPNDYAVNVLSALVYMNGTTDYAELYVYQNSGGNHAVVAGANRNCFQAHLARPA